MLIPYASSSKGNFYEVWDGYSRILLECGVPPKRMRVLCGRQLSDYGACLITHEHSDHAKAASAAELGMLGVRLCASAGTFDALNLQFRHGYDCSIARAGELIDIAGYHVMPFPVFHDCAEPLCYGIESRVTGERLFFAVDTSCLLGTGEGFDEIALECNYSEDYLMDSKLDHVVVERIRRNHMSIERVLEWLKASDLTRTRLIWLLHISANHGDALLFRRMVEGTTGICTRIASA
ncbi:MAG: hypothetical protein LBB86_06965 [Oscillospiraceae bacterium]|jgi:phosphoribosyl 1,2-cyclic phosphodiesterase|nr:hypothetical protein [Oscillospiraceae bacterium]